MYGSFHKKPIVFLFVLLALAVLTAGALGEGEYRLLQEGCYGNDVLSVKERLKALGYFSGTSFNNRYTEDTMQRVKNFEKACGLEPTGILTPALQRILFSDPSSSQNTDPDHAAASLSENESPCRDIGPDDNGDDVLRLKERLKELGYFTAKAETASYNDTLAAAIRNCQSALGLETTGIADSALQDLLYSDGPAAGNSDVSSAGSTSAASSVSSSAVPTAVPAPTAAPDGPVLPVALPELDEQGFLKDKDASPFIHADRDDGHWYYISGNVYIEIIRYQNTKQKLIWFETEIRCTPSSLPQAFLAHGSRADGHNFITPVALGKQYDLIFGISDDFYGYRWYNRSKGLKQGTIIRNGTILADESQPASSKKWPYLEVLALFEDGSMRAFESDEHTAQEYLDMGTVDTFAFGPILVRDGMIDAELYDKSIARYYDDEPRMAIGCIEPCHYIIVTAKGRYDFNGKALNGVTLAWLAERMRSLGCENALNLDGGGTVALYFMGDVINYVKNTPNLRDISSMFGYAAQ